MNAGKLFIYLLFIMILVWYTAIWAIYYRVRADTSLTDFTVETVKNGGECLRKSKLDDRLLVRYTIKIHGSDTVIETRLNEDSPYVVHLGQFVDIPTLERGLYDMCEEESRSMVVPPLLGYGVKDSQTKQGNLVPGNSTLQYEVTLVKIFSKEESEPRQETVEQEEGTVPQTSDGEKDSVEETNKSEVDAATKEKDKLIITNMMGDAMKAVVTSKEGKGIAGMAKKMIGGIFGGGSKSNGNGMAGMIGKLAAGMMGNTGSNGGEGMAGLMGKLAGAMGGGGGGMEGIMEQLAGAMGNQGTGGMEGLLGQLGDMMGKGDGNNEGLAAIMSQLGAGGAGNGDGLAAIMSQLGGEGGAGLMGLIGQLGGANGGQMAEKINKMLQKQKERKNRKTEL
ncbi:uncharacterized protein [Argopecten irradians]|uniref:uncharacterized protein n=1 Tax=Argopecten irradians TaxID=31199 RepID=UPI003713BDB7